MKCKEHEDFMICPADRAVINHEFKTCLLSLYLQAEDASRVCERRLHTVQKEPFLLLHGADIIIFAPVPGRAFFRYQLGNRWKNHNPYASWFRVDKGGCRMPHRHRSIAVAAGNAVGVPLQQPHAATLHLKRPAVESGGRTLGSEDVPRHLLF
jgi:hypothetical protein